MGRRDVGSGGRRLMVLPTPKKVVLKSGAFRPPPRFFVRSSAVGIDLRSLMATSLKPLKILRKDISVSADLQHKPHLRVLIGAEGARLPAVGRLGRAILGPEGYRLTVRGTSILVEAREEAGLFYGIMTLRQLMRNHERIPCCVIEDWPDMAVRGIHMDLKGCTPTVAYMKRLIPKLAEYKINTLLMEYENVVALDATPGVAKPSAWSKKDVAALANLARRNRITLMPLLQSLGHVEYILQHEGYKRFREDQEDVSQYCPSNPDVFSFFREQAEEIIEFFPESKYFHVGADETRLLGHCPKCRARLRKGEDKLDIYLDHMTKVFDYIKGKGYTPIFWDDIVTRDFSPERMKRIPEGVAAMYWLYRIYHEDETSVVTDSGSYCRRDLITHETLTQRRKIGSHTKWLDEMPIAEWRNYRKYLDKDEFKPGFHSAPYVEMLADYGMEVLGASAIKCGGGGTALPPLADTVDNVRVWANHIAKAKQSGMISTSWSRGASLRHPYLPVDTMWYGMAASAQFYWSAETSVEEFQVLFSRDFFGRDDDGWAAQVLEAAAMPGFSVAQRELEALSVTRNREVLEAFRIGAEVEGGFRMMMACMAEHAKGYYLNGLPNKENRNIYQARLPIHRREYLALEERAAEYYHRVMLPEEADELLEALFRFFKDALPKVL
jgi:Glycosyl hydrolase family 20, domain 2/Glycosyl hydrolase family 20, catalytic domain